MGNADYMAAFLHVLLPLAFEVTLEGVEAGGEGYLVPRGSSLPTRVEQDSWGLGGSLWRGVPSASAPASFLSLPTGPCLQFDPELVLVSAGFDSAIGDPEVRAWPGFGGLLGPQARPSSRLALAAGADAGHAGVLRPPHAAAAGAGWRPGLRRAGGDRSEGEGAWAEAGEGYWQRLLPCGAGHSAWGPDRPACHVSASSSSQGGYHVESLSQSVCMMVRALLGDPALPLSGPMEPHGRCGAERKEGGKGQGGRPGLLILLLLAVPWSPSSVCGQPRPLTG